MAFLFIRENTNDKDNMDSPKLSVVIPVFNDVKGLENAIPKTVSTLESFGVSFEIIIAEDGSTDGTRELAEDFCKMDSRIVLNHSDLRRGKGGALSDSLEVSQGELFCFFDVDLSTDLRHISDLLEKISAGYDIIIGSRMIAGAEVIRSGNREFTSKAFNFLVRTLLHSKIHDHQCGFKCFRADALRKIIPYVKSRGWTWDTEVLSLAEASGLSVLEIPVIWTQGGATNVRLPDYFAMGMDVFRLAVRLRRHKDMPPKV